ncbi:cardiotrophin-1 [Rhinophrynus dorsalis]
MEVLRAEAVSLILSSEQEQQCKELKLQVLNQVSVVNEESKDLVSEYLKHQGAPFSRPGFNSPLPKIEGLPILEVHLLHSSPVKNLLLSHSAFCSLAGWFDAVLHWQKRLNPGAHHLLARLDTCRQQARALYSNLSLLLEESELAIPSTPTVSEVFRQKIIGYAVCQCFCDWLYHTKRAMVILVAETPV